MPLSRAKKARQKPQRSGRTTRKWTTRSVVMIIVAVALFATTAGAAGAYYGFRVRGGGHSDALVRCNGGMTRLSHVFSEDASVFPGDPPPDIDIVFTVPNDGFLVEEITSGTHTGTHIDAPIHFIDGGRSVDDLQAEDLVWPAYVIDVRPQMTGTHVDAYQLTVDDLKRYERRIGRIPRGALVILQTGFETKFGLDGATPGEDDYVIEAFPGFSEEAVQWLFDARRIGALGSDTLGPDASNDPDFIATFTALANDGITFPGMNNLDSLNRVGDIVIASTVRLGDGSGFMVDPLACHKR